VSNELPNVPEQEPVVAGSPPTSVEPPPIMATQNARKTPSEASQSRPPSPLRSPSPTHQHNHSQISQAFDYHQESQDFRNHPFNQDILVPETTSQAQDRPENTEILPDVQSLEEQCQYYSDMYQQLSEQYNAMLQDFQFCQESLSSLQFEYGTINAQYSDLMHICTAREKEIEQLHEKVHQLENSNKELLHKKDAEMEQLKLQLKSVSISQLDATEDMEEAIRTRMKNTLLDLDTQSAQLKERKQWCRNEEDRLQKWEDDLNQEKNRLIELDSELHLKSDSLNKKEVSLKELTEELNQQRAKLEQGQNWLRMEEEELIEKQKKNTALLDEKSKELRLLEEELVYRGEQIDSLQAQLDIQCVELDKQSAELEAAKLELEQLRSYGNPEKSNALGLSQEPMDSAEVQQWIDYYNTKCAELDLAKQELVNEKESYKALSAQLQKQLESFSHQLEHYPVKQVVSEEEEQRELALRKREQMLEEKLKQLELQRHASHPVEGNQFGEVLERIDQLSQTIYSREIAPLQVPELKQLSDRISTLESTNQQLMNYLSSMHQKLDMYKPNSTSDFCTAITELSRYYELI
jgi:myosin heavy subunit